MQRFDCPFCGPRPETEFHFAAEAGKTRPVRDCSDADWAAYLHMVRNAKGAVCEIWVHRPCREMFVMERDSATMEVQGSTALRGAP
ncbi:sarcosine oxidase subunit delta [Jannaschia seohaensis]|uniref:Sarcosine oxidase subunit delta n=1 Tax=Jannaschia seohaensis TaxID=475081 RepID=A0A2Y9B5L4_9RHOB|nr:sarcosine oxidase subunit delta [Jannaschia seohaensis]PWJ13774.1 sarcosine oxidase subunit delta [Jannaschia seohaensis]SSA50287.1 sarcosine oxidase subunit delta [Jannaschia seohaensis]